MKRLSKKNILILAILFIFVVMVVAVDLILVYTSLQETGVGRGFSRYWTQEE